jgi:hypothetical protein
MTILSVHLFWSGHVFDHRRGHLILWYLAYFIVSYKVVCLSSWWLRCAALRTSTSYLIYAYSPNWAIRYGLEGPGIESRWGRHFLHPSRSSLGPTKPPFKCVPDLFPGGKAVGTRPWPPTPSLYRATKKVELYLFLRWDTQSVLTDNKYMH